MKKINKQYDALVKSHQKEMKDAILYLKTEMERRNCKFGENVVPTFLKPFFVSSEEVAQISEVLDHVVNILDKVSRLYFERKDLGSYFSLNKVSQELIKIDQGYRRNVVIARPDSFIHNDVLRFVEFNCDSPAGPGLADVEEEIFNTTFPIARVKKKYEITQPHRRRHLLNALVNSYKEFGGKKKNPNIAIVDWKEVRTQNEFRILQAFFEEQGYDTVIADPRDLKYRGGKLEFNGFPIDLIYRRVIFKELVEKLDQCGDFIKAYKSGKVCVVNPLRSRLAANKAMMAIITNLREFNSIFTEEEQLIIKKHIPWTRRVQDMQTNYENNKVFLRKHIRTHKDTLVLKPADGYGGKGVLIGRECDQADWDMAVNEILSKKEDWVVQKYIEISEMNVPILNGDSVDIAVKKCNLNPFVFNDVYAGSMARLSDQSVINVSAGGGLIPVVEYSNK